MKLGDYADLLQYRLVTLLERYKLNYYRLYFSKANLDDFESIVVDLVRTLLPNDVVKVLKVTENLAKRQYEVHLEINLKPFVFTSSTEDSGLGNEFWNKIFLLPNFSSHDIRLTTACNATLFLGEEIFFISGNPEILVEAYNSGLPISNPKNIVWYYWIDHKKIDKSKFFYLKLELEQLGSSFDLKRLLLNGINLFARKGKFLSVSSEQLELIELSRSKILRKLPIVGDVNYDAWVAAYVNGDSLPGALLLADKEICLEGRLSDYIWAYTIVKEFRCDVNLIPYKENPNPSKIVESSKFLEWVDEFMSDFLDINDSPDFVFSS